MNSGPVANSATLPEAARTEDSLRKYGNARGGVESATPVRGRFPDLPEAPQTQASLRKCKDSAHDGLGSAMTVRRCLRDVALCDTNTYFTLHEFSIAKQVARSDGALIHHGEVGEHLESEDSVKTKIKAKVRGATAD